MPPSRARADAAAERREPAMARKKSPEAAKKSAKARPALGRQSPDRQGLRRCAGAGLYRGHAGLEKRGRAPPRRADRAHRPRRAQGGQMESPFYGVEDRAGSSASIASRSTSRWPSSAARRCVRSRRASPSSRKCATSTSMRTTARRSAARRLGETGQPIARRTNVRGETVMH